MGINCIRIFAECWRAGSMILYRKKLKPERKREEEDYG